MEDARIPAHLEVSGLIRSVQAAGGFATVLAKGEKTACDEPITRHRRPPER